MASLSNLWDQELVKSYLQAASKASPPSRVTLREFIDSSHDFLRDFPSSTARASTLVKQGRSEEKLTNQINSAYPVINERCIPLLVTFLDHKKRHGTPIEKSVYENMDFIAFVDRLLTQRPASFFARFDQYLLRDGVQGKGGFESIGTPQEVSPLCLKDYLSYDEIKVSALMSVSSESWFINDGNRTNRGVSGKRGTYQEDGVIVGMVGSRLKKAGYMEWQDCVVTKRQNSKYNGYGTLDGPPRIQQVWSRLWGGPLPEWSSVSPNDEKFFKLEANSYFNKEVYKKRMQLGAETLLAEAMSKAKAKRLKAYIHVVGLGLGVWRACDQQDALFVDAWGEALKTMNTNDIAHVDFSWIGATSCLGVKNGETFPKTNVTIHFTKRSLHDPVPDGNLLVVNYAWDGNSLPGNEYWLGKLASTGDGAAACSSGVAELHNSYINNNVCGKNLHVSGRYGVIHIGEYAKKFLSQGKSKETSKNLSQEKSAEASKNLLQEKSAEASKNLSQEKSAEASKNVWQEKSADASKNLLQGKSAEPSKKFKTEANKNAKPEISKNAKPEISKNAKPEISKNAKPEASKNATMETSKTSKKEDSQNLETKDSTNSETQPSNNPVKEVDSIPEMDDSDSDPEVDTSGKNPKTEASNNPETGGSVKKPKTEASNNPENGASSKNPKTEASKKGNKKSKKKGKKNYLGSQRLFNF